MILPRHIYSAFVFLLALSQMLRTRRFEHPNTTARRLGLGRRAMWRAISEAQHGRA